LDLDNLLRTVGRHWRTVASLRGARRALLLSAAVLFAAALAEWLLQPGDAALLLLGACTALAVSAGWALSAWPLRVKPADRQIARFVEERVPELEDTLVTAVDVRDRPADHSFAPLVVSAASARVRALDLDRVFDPAESRAAWRGALVAAAVFAVAFWLAGPFIARTAQVAYVKLFPGAVSVQVSTGDMRIPAGRPVTLGARVSGRHVALDRIAPVVTLESAGKAVTVAMERTATGYELRIPALERSFTYGVTAGPARSRNYTVTALFPPRVQRIELHYDYPSFSGLKARDEHDGGDVYGPAGTRVRLVVHADKPVSQGRLAFSEGRPAQALSLAGERALESTLTVKEESAYRVALVDADGLSSEGTEYFIRVMDDRPPVVHILRPSGDQQITPLDEVPIEARADDDFGVASLDMVYSVSGGAEKVVPFTSLGGTELARIGSRMLAAEDLKVKPGDVIAYYARARDVARGKQSTLARSEIFFLEVKPFNEEYSLAQSQAGMAAATGTQLEGLIAAQKEIISATWNLERRSGAGRSAADIKDVAEAQAELKARAEQAAGQSRSRRRMQQPFLQLVFPGAAAQAPQPADDPVRMAVDAMNRAVQQLQTQKTAGAIPHEMAALNALLQAQAEIRKRQVTQQQQNNGGGGFGNRQTQDLSTLFDRELKRQQRTNYETKAQVETQPESAKSDSALDKIKDLARRQEELSRQQRELAKGGVSAEEMKRQLEKLTRDQEELRRQLEEARREAGKRAEGAQGASGASANSAKGAEQDVNKALEQMRQAAEQGKREDAAGAAAKGEEAARQLRQAESQMQNGSGDAKKRALGDLQLESQQVADEQRRIANEADRLDREGGGAADARRRLAGEKDRLAERVEGMQQAAQRLGADAAGDIGSQKLADRMRQSAQGMRDGKQGRMAPAEQQLAEALDKVARRLNGADAGGAKGETQQLAGQLDELRDARERLARLERQIADAKQAAESGRGRDGAPQAGRAGQSSQPQQGQQGQQGRSGSRGDGAGGDLQQLQQQYNQELQRTRELMDRVQRGTPDSGGRMGTPEQHEWSRSAPGTEAFKQDYAAWQSLASDVTKALERAETNVAGRLSNAVAKDRLRAGGSERVPDAYRDRVSRYFESIAIKKK
jgi:hypothetical protein